MVETLESAGSIGGDGVEDEASDKEADEVNRGGESKDFCSDGATVPLAKDGGNDWYGGTAEINHNSAGESEAGAGGFLFEVMFLFKAVF